MSAPCECDNRVSGECPVHGAPSPDGPVEPLRPSDVGADRDLDAVEVGLINEALAGPWSNEEIEYGRKVYWDIRIGVIDAFVAAGWDIAPAITGATFVFKAGVSDG